MDTYQQLELQHHENKVVFLNAVATEYQRAKSKYNFGDRKTWDDYVFWRSKYDILHHEVTKMQK